jgi:Tol biopolymer transport system component
LKIEPGQDLLHYRIVEKIGEGGMGAVWRAVDTHLDREVAIKLLPEGFAGDPDRLARFDREAKLLASLNHPNIAGIYGFHPASSTDSPSFLAMELVEGEDLAERLARGPLPVDETLHVGRQIAEALEAAHAGGVIHRDLKPANIKLTPDGKIKVLDFGLAKAMSPSEASQAAEAGPTLTSAGTRAGMILGTAAYMSPEQARGKPLDRRTDLWSFGCVLYECLTATQLFRGETVSDSLAAILRKDPNWSNLPAATPPMVRLLLRRCLTREPAKRLQDAGDARIEIEQAIEDPRGESLGLAAVGESVRAEAPSKTRWLPWAVAVVALAFAVMFAMRGTAPTPQAGEASRLMIPVPGPTEFGDNLASPPAVSPDGRTVVFGAIEDDGGTRLWLRPIDDFAPHPLNDTKGAAYAFWSPDSRHIGFFVGGKLKRIEVATGRVQTIGGEGSSSPRGGSWHANGQIVYAPNSNTGIHVIDAAGGESRQVTAPDPDVPDSSHRWPFFLPDGEHFLFVSWTNDLRAQEEHGGVYVASLTDDRTPERVVADASSMAYVSPGYLLVVRGDNLIAIPFDANKRKVTGEAVVIATGVLRSRANAYSAFSASMEGTLVYAVGQAFLPATLTWFDRDGNSTVAGVDSAAYSDLRLAPSSRTAATVIPGANGDGQVWIIDLLRGVRTRLASGFWTHANPLWSNDGNRIMFATQEYGGLDFVTRFADGSGEQESVLVDGADKTLLDWSRDGKYVAYSPIGSGSGTPDIWIYSLETQNAEALIAGEPTHRSARFSPDSRWIAYVSNESGRMEVFVQAFGGDGDIGGGARWQLSTAGGTSPHWRDDGREIVYVEPGGRVMSVAVTERDGRLALGSPQELFTVEGTIATGDATGDHERFLLATRDEVDTEPLRVVLDWPADLRLP